MANASMDSPRQPALGSLPASAWCVGSPNGASFSSVCHLFLPSSFWAVGSKKRSICAGASPAATRRKCLPKKQIADRLRRDDMVDIADVVPVPPGATQEPDEKTAKARGYGGVRDRSKR